MFVISLPKTFFRFWPELHEKNCNWVKLESPVTFLNKDIENKSVWNFSKLGRKLGPSDISNVTESFVVKTNVVISQTHWLVSQERLLPMAGTTLFIEYTVVPSVKQ